MIEKLKDPAIQISLLTLAFYTGGFVLLTKNHLKHLAQDVRKVLHIQKRQGKRIARIERRMDRYE